MTPTKERMTELWDEMLSWPIGHRMSFALQLAHSVINESGSNHIDAGMFDPVAGVDVYLVAGRGEGADGLKRYAEAIKAETGESIVLKVGDEPTPFSCDIGLPKIINTEDQ